MGTLALPYFPVRPLLRSVRVVLGVVAVLLLSLMVVVAPVG